MLENRAVMKRVFPELFRYYAIHPVDDYPRELRNCLASLSPRDAGPPKIVVLTPGIYNSAYFEHSYLAQLMGAELVEGSDLVVDRDDCVYMRTIGGLVRVDVIYRRIDDLFLDPDTFQPIHAGAPGLMRAWRDGKVAFANAPGCGVADDKVIYSYVPTSSGTTWRRSPSSQRANLPVRGKRLAGLRARPHRGTGREARQRVGRLRHADRPHSTRRERETFRRASAPTRATTSGSPS